ncbi:putative transcriptional regulator YheO [Bacilli bacterium PM5-3]|nr:putative transcriptional regulator YheO [Bacilli bacterium PM5-3]MDH6604259.1 putative transcriptional regulator YheO [Bacilli bacterium PM5-9]
MNDKLKRYVILVDFLKEMFGPNYEIVLHDIKQENGAIVAIANGDITGRKIGDPLTTFALNTIATKKYEEVDYVLNYHAKSNYGRLLRSSTLYIKDNNELIGLLCINFDDTKFLDLTEQLRKLVHPDEVLYRRENIEKKDDPIENIAESIADVTKNVINDFFYRNNFNLAIMEVKQRKKLVEGLNQDDRFAIIKTLNDNGVFLIKGAVSEVANELFCSEPTVYRYLSKLK